MFFIAFEGLDGSGKTTQAALLTKWLRDQGHSVYQSFEPFGSLPIWYDKEISPKDAKKRLDDLVAEDSRVSELSPKDRALKFIDSFRNRQMPNISKSRADFVVMDRWKGSLFAYQCYGENVSLEWVLDELYNDDGCKKNVLSPDLEITLDISLQEANKRVTARGAECRSFVDGLDMEEVYNKFCTPLHFVTRDSSIHIDALLPVDAIELEVRAAVNKALWSKAISV